MFIKSPYLLRINIKPNAIIINPPAREKNLNTDRFSRYISKNLGKNREAARNGIITPEEYTRR